MRRILLGILVVLLSAPIVGDTSTGNLGQAASRLRGLSYAPVPARQYTQDQAAAYILKLLKKELKPTLTLTRQSFLKRLGLMPRNSSIKKILSKLYASQVRGIYDPAKKIYIVVKNDAGSESATDIAAAMLGVDTTDIYTVHELEHAIQDQHFNLSKISRSVAKHGDRAFAAQSVIEGDATLVMMDYMLDKMGMSGSGIDLTGGGMGSIDESQLKGLGLEEMGIDTSAISGGATGPLAEAPIYFRESLQAPYEEGMRFVATLRKKGGWKAVDKSFRQLPKSSEHIYHPEKYLFGRDNPKIVSLRHLPTQLGKYKMLTEDVAGEFTVRVLAKQYKLPMKGAEGWGGDRYRTYHNGKYGFCVWHTRWDTVQDAKEFLNFIQVILKKRLAAEKKRGVKTVAYQASIKGSTVKVWLGVPQRFMKALP